MELQLEMGFGATYMQFDVRLEQAACGGRGASDVGSNSREIFLQTRLPCTLTSQSSR